MKSDIYYHLQTSQAGIKAGKVYRKYTTMTATELIGYMEDYPELHIIMDTKEEEQVEVKPGMGQQSSCM